VDFSIKRESGEINVKIFAYEQAVGKEVKKEKTL
jgi:hypothetical protein